MAAVASIELKQNIIRAMDDGLSRLEPTATLREKAIARCEAILESGSDRDATRIITAIIAMERLQLDRDLAASGQSTGSIRLSAPANLADVHALLEAMRNPSAASDSTLPQVASIPPAEPQQPGDGPAQSQ